MPQIKWPVRVKDRAANNCGGTGVIKRQGERGSLNEDSEKLEVKYHNPVSKYTWVDLYNDISDFCAGASTGGSARRSWGPHRELWRNSSATRTHQNINPLIFWFSCRFYLQVWRNGTGDSPQRPPPPASLSSLFSSEGKQGVLERNLKLASLLKKKN